MNDRLNLLAQSMQIEGALLGGQLTAASLKQALEERRAVTIERDDTVAAFGSLWFREGSVELGSLWVSVANRNQGLCSQIFRSLLDRAPTHLPLFLITHDPHVMHLALKHGMTEATPFTWTASIPVASSCGPCDRLPDAEKSRCPFKAVHNECRLFVRS